MKVALAHEYFSVHGGAERVVEVFHAMWADAPVYTFFHDRARYGALDGWDLRVSYLNAFPLGGGLHRLLLPLYPGAARRLRVDADTDVLLGSTSAFIKGVALPEHTVHVAYCHSPTRYLWDASDQYLDDEVPAPLRPMVRELLSGLREDDRRFASRVDRWIANSYAVQGRIARYYGATAEVVHPPVDVDAFATAERKDDFWLFVPSRLSAYKRGDLAVRVFNELGRRLIVVGDGRERGSLERLAKDNVTFVGRVDDATLKELLGAARGLVFPGEDDFGIVCAEALASGTPVVALARGGAPEIVRDGVEGRLVAEPEVGAFVEAIRDVERDGVDPEALRQSARRFALGAFRDKVRAIVDDAAHRGRAAGGGAPRGAPIRARGPLPPGATSGDTVRNK